MRPKNRERLLKFKDSRNVEQLLMLPVRIAEHVRSKKCLSRQEALDLQMALAVELLLMCPIRRGNLVRLRIGPGGHLRLNQGQRRTVHIVIPDHEVKNGEPIDAPIPRETAELLRTYLERGRPVLSDAPGDWLFPGERPNTYKSLDHVTRHYAKTMRAWQSGVTAVRSTIRKSAPKRRRA